MKTLKKILSGLFCLFFITVDTSVTFAQGTSNPATGSNVPFTGTGAVPLVSSGTDALRTESKSFGTKQGKGVTTTLSLPQRNEGQVFQETTYGGLDYQIHILGEVNRPGTYRVTASTRLSEALQKVGGILDRGSERRIQLRRRLGGDRQVDLLAFKLGGNLDANPYLLENDVIFVPLKGKVVQIEGTVKRPGIYELIKERTLEDLVSYVGGFTPGLSSPAAVKVIRFAHGEKKVIEVENKEEARRRFELQNGDVVVIPHLLTAKKKFDYNLAGIPGDNPLFYPSFEERVFVLGAVSNSGVFPYNPYYKAGQYLTLAGGKTKLAKRGKLRLISVEGKKTSITLGADVSPGDAIVVRERYMPPETLVSLVLGLAASALGLSTTILNLTR